MNMSKAGRGRGVETTTNCRNDLPFVQTINNDKRNSTSPVPSLAESSKKLYFDEKIRRTKTFN